MLKQVLQRDTAKLMDVNPPGDDADTNDAVCGQLAGAYWGESGISQEWREELACEDIIEPIPSRLSGRRTAECFALRQQQFHCARSGLLNPARTGTG